MIADVQLSPERGSVSYVPELVTDETDPLSQVLCAQVGEDLDHQLWGQMAEGDFFLLPQQRGQTVIFTVGDLHPFLLVSSFMLLY